MATVVVTLLLGFAAILQNTIISRINLLVGAADLVLLVLISWILQIEDKNLLKYGLIAGVLVGISSAVPLWAPLFSYSLVAGLVMMMNARIWQAPYWMLLTTTFFGTIVVYGVDIIVLWATGYPFNLIEMANIVILPSVVLNVLFIMPVYFFVGEIVKMVAPKEVQL